jgi:hypothetical protein
MLGFLGYLVLTLILWLALQWQVSLSEAESGHHHDH